MNRTPLIVMSTHHRRTLWGPSLWVAVAGLALALIFALDVRHLAPLACTLAITALVAVLVRLRRRTAHHESARTLDNALDAKNRFEASAELGRRTDALATAQQAETATFLAQRPAPVSHGWITGLILLGLLILVHLGSFSVVGFKMLTAPPSIASQPKSPEPVAPPPATLDWKSPRPETTATQVEEVPLTAQAESITGLHHLTLHVTLNGENLPPIAVPAAVAAGPQTVPLSLYIDELAAQPYDMVTYYLTAERVVAADTATPSPSWPAITSPLQFIQIRPLRDDLQLGPQGGGGGDGTPAEKFLEIVKRLKLAQLNLLKETFALDHGQPPRTQPDWPGLVQAAGTEQTVIAEKTAATNALGQTQGAPAEGIDLLAQTHAEMEAASAALAIPDATLAGPPIGRALARLTAVEKLYTKILNRGKSAAKAPPKAPDPFSVDQHPKLPPREETAAGQLEKLSAAQSKIAETLAQNPPAQGQEKAVSAEQLQLARDLEKLAAKAGLPAATIDAVKTAAASAQEAATQLAAEDSAAAAEPAARAAAALHAAVAALDAAGRDQAASALAAAQQSLNQAAGDLQGSAPGQTGAAAAQAAQRAADTREALHAAAERQQKQGSAEAAQKLEALAKAITDSKVQADLKKLVETDATSPSAAVAKLSALAQQAADAQGRLGDPQELQARALDELRLIRANLDRAAKAGPEALNDLHARALHQAQLAGSTGVGAEAIDGGEVGETRISHIIDDLNAAAASSPENHDPKPPKVYAAALATPIDTLITLLTSTAATNNRPQILTTGNADEAPAAYRPAVSAYFETLAHPKPKASQP